MTGYCIVDDSASAPLVEELQGRLQQLKGELEQAQVELDNVERRRTYLREMMLRISGAVQVLEELAQATELWRPENLHPENLNETQGESTGSEAPASATMQSA